MDRLAWGHGLHAYDIRPDGAGLWIAVYRDDRERFRRGVAVMSLLSNSLWEPVTPSGEYVVNTPAGTISATTVQAAINELDTEKVPYVDPHYVAAKLVVATIFGAR